MKFLLPPSMVRSMASSMRHINNVHPHLVDPVQRGFVLSTSVSVFSPTMNIVELALESTNSHMTARLWTRYGSPEHFDPIDIPIILSTKFWKIALPRLRKRPYSINVLEFNENKQPNLLQVVKISDVNNRYPSSKVMGENLFWKLPQPFEPVVDVFTHNQPIPLPASDPIIKNADPKGDTARLISMSYRDSASYTLDHDDKSRILISRWLRDDVTTTAGIRLTN